MVGDRCLGNTERAEQRGIWSVVVSHPIIIRPCHLETVQWSYRQKKQNTEADNLLRDAGQLVKWEVSWMINGLRTSTTHTAECLSRPPSRSDALPLSALTMLELKLRSISYVSINLLGTHLGKNEKETSGQRHGGVRRGAAHSGEHKVNICWLASQAAHVQHQHELVHNMYVSTSSQGHILSNINS